MHIRRTHRITALGLAATLLLAGCGSGDEDPSVEEAAIEVEDSEEDITDEDDSADDESPEDDSVEDDDEEESTTLASGLANKLSSVPEVDWTEVEESPDHLLLAPGLSLRVTQTALLDEVEPEVAAQVSEAHGETRLLPSDGEVFLLATVVIEDSQWEDAEADSEGTVRVAGNQVPAIFFTGGSGEREQSTYLLSIPEGTAAEEAVLEVTTGDVVQTLSLIDGARVDSDVEPIYQAGTEVTVDGEGWSHVFDSWASGTHEVNGQVTGAVITPYVDDWARPGHVFVGVDIDARDNGGADDDITTIQIELPDGSTVTPENDPSSLKNRFAERAWFQVPADSEQLTLHVNPMGKAGLDEIDFESPVDVTLTIEGAVTGGATDAEDPGADADDAGDSDDAGDADEDDASSDESEATEAPGSTD